MNKCCTCTHWSATDSKDYHPVTMKYDFAACRYLSTNEPSTGMQVEVRICGPRCSATSHVYTKGTFSCPNYLEV